MLIIVDSATGQHAVLMYIYYSNCIFQEAKQQKRIIIIIELNLRTVYSVINFKSNSSILGSLRISVVCLYPISYYQLQIYLIVDHRQCLKINPYCQKQSNVPFCVAFIQSSYQNLQKIVHKLRLPMNLSISSIYHNISFDFPNTLITYLKYHETLR